MKKNFIIEGRYVCIYKFIIINYFSKYINPFMVDKNPYEQIWWN